MRFASQIKELEISGIRKCFEGAGPGAINLGLGQPDFDTPSHIKDAAIKAIQQGFTGYTANFGFLDLQLAISQKFERENQIKYSPEEIMVTSGASEALFLAIAALVDRGDEVLIGDPGFLSYSALTKTLGGRPIGVPLSDRLTLTPQAVSEKITSRTKAIIINSPSNPTGSVQRDEELRGISQIADDKDIAIISDEVYEHLIYDGQ